MKKILLMKTMLLLCALVAGSGSVWAIDDVINNSATSTNLGNTASNTWATNFSINGASGATYYIHSLGTKNTANALQWNANGFLYATKSGGKLKSVSITGTAGKSVNIYASNTAYSSKASGTALSKITLTGGTGTYEFTSDYEYIAINGTEGSTSLTSITITYADPTKVATPTFSVPEGTYNEEQNVTLSCITEDAIIYFTTDGTTPTASSNEYTGTITVNRTTTIKALAFKDGLDDSDVASAAYTLKCETPSFTIPSGAFVSSKVVTMASTEGATIYYTTDGSTPTISSTAYDSSNKPTISATTTYNAIAVKDGWTNSNEGTETFTKETVLEGLSALVAKTDNSDANYYVNLSEAQVTWVNNTIGYMEDASAGVYLYQVSPTLNKIYNGIFYVKYQLYNSMPEIKSISAVEGSITDGSTIEPSVMTPAALDAAFDSNLGRQIQINSFTVAAGRQLTENIALYSTSPYTSITTGTTYTLKGYPFYAKVSGTLTKQFRIVSAIEKPEAPTFDPAEGEFSNAFTLHLACASDGATIYYTTDGSTPTESSTEYDDAEGISISAGSDATVKAIAVMAGMKSDVASATYTYKAISKPVFTPADGAEVYYGETVAITSDVEGSTIHYTIDGTAPTTSSTAYSAPVAITDAVTLKAIAAKGSDESSVASASYTLKTPDAPTFNVAAGYVENGTELTITSRAGTTIYYTIDGSDPNNADDSNSNSVKVTVNADMTVRAIAVDGATNISAESSAAYELYSDPDFSYNDMTMEIGDQKVPVVIENNSEGTVTFESANDAIATIVDGKVKAVAKGTVTITASVTANGKYHEKSTTFTVTVINAAKWEEIAYNKGVDELTNATFDLTTGSSYTDFSNKKASSNAVYAGQGCKGNDYIQIRVSGNNSGVVTTTSGGKARKIVVAWNSVKGSNGNTIDIYGNSSAYTSAANLFNTTSQGTKLGSIVKGTSTELKVDGEYDFIGIRSNNGTCYLDKITIYWEGDAVSLSDASDYSPVAKDYAKVTLNREFVEGWNGVVLPFDLTTSVKTALGASEVKTLGDATTDGDAVTLAFTDAALPVSAGTPVLLKLATALESGDVILNGVEIKTTTPTTTAKTISGSTYTLTGTYSEVDLEDSEAYFVSDDKFYHKAAGVPLTAAPFRAYIVQTGTAPARTIFDLEGSKASGISDLNVETTDESRSIYSLDGRRVARFGKRDSQQHRLQSGLYIMNGKKVVVK